MTLRPTSHVTDFRNLGPAARQKHLTQLSPVCGWRHDSDMVKLVKLDHFAVRVTQEKAAGSADR